MPNKSDTALLLRRTPYGESSLVVHALTRRHGRIHLLAKGAYRPTSRIYCVLDFFDTLELEWNESPRRELDLVVRGDRARRRREIPASPGLYRAALTMIELAGLAAQPGQADPKLYDALEGGLERLTRGEDDLEPARFEASLLDVLGLSPALVLCAACGKEAPPRRGGSEDRVFFSAAVGGRLCSSCAEEARAAGQRVGTLPLHVIEAAAMLAGGDRPPAPDELTLERVRDLFERFLAYHLERHPRLLRDTLARRAPEHTAAGVRSPIPPRT